MNNWNFGIYADQTHTTICYAASVLASTQRQAIKILRKELTSPAPLYIGPLDAASFAALHMPLCTPQDNEDIKIVLVRLHRSSD